VIPENAAASGEEVDRRGLRMRFWILPVTELARWGCASRYLLHAPGSTRGKILFLIAEAAGDSYWNGAM
jgi:hypothetical protein